VGHDLSYANSNLNLLSLCSYNSDTARTLYLILQVIFNDIREIIVSPANQSIHRAVPVPNDPAETTQRIEDEEMTSIRDRDLAERVLIMLQQRLNF
jgi:hypothetical protein